jgi:hypothetical protein
VIAGAAFFLGLGFVLVCPTSDVARNRIAHTFHADLISLSSFFTEFCTIFMHLKANMVTTLFAQGDSLSNATDPAANTIRRNQD